VRTLMRLRTRLAVTSITPWAKTRTSNKTGKLRHYQPLAQAKPLAFDPALSPCSGGTPRESARLAAGSNERCHYVHV
jgi:hypothetical protein